ncbi:HAD-IIA family hydrolase [Pelagibaculum spongiae]|uniref:TIGR01457 family HAD-type hydrolase n=1 Tax=Pelagibaculum spongiae TaxID=2080658 RepID=A0A2V1GW64_9GAMM|nr:HAD-IIA family hydrolase [Pelagibaculum spongiae]PVZ70260.1 TIGR01457 family HAD-type hydrolase [Pelagibaculum spongiae]
MTPSLLIFDLDGTVYQGNQVIAGAPEFFSQLVSNNIRYIFATNRADRRAEVVSEQLNLLGIACQPDQVITSSMVAADMVAGQRVFAIGGEAVSYYLEQQGCVLASDQVDSVVVGFDPEINLEKLTIATRLIKNGAHFIGTNPDPTILLDDGLMPECGALLGAIEISTNQKPKIVGKPEAAMIHFACKKAGVNPEQAIMIGDYLYTDIAAANAAGCKSVLLLTGISTQEQLDSSDIQPSHVCSTYDELASYI